MTPAAARLALAALVALPAAAAVAYAAGTEGDGDLSARGSWRALAPATLERSEVAAARIGGAIYVVGGFEARSGKSTGALERYDIARNRWRRLRSLPVAVNHPAATSYRGRLYVHGGYTGEGGLTSPTARLYSYDPVRNRWRRLPSSPGPRAAHAFAALRGRLYAAGGRDATDELRSVVSYDPRRRRWRRERPLAGPARDHTAGVAAGGFFYVVGGRDVSGGPGNYRDAERFNPRTRRWRRLAPLRRARGGIAAAALSRGRLAVFGGEDLGPGGKTISEVELFDPQTGRWRALPALRTPRHGLGGASRGGRVYSLQGGREPGFHFSNVLEFLDVP